MYSYLMNCGALGLSDHGACQGLGIVWMFTGGGGGIVAEGGTGCGRTRELEAWRNSLRRQTTSYCRQSLARDAFYHRLHRPLNADPCGIQGTLRVRGCFGVTDSQGARGRIAVDNRTTEPSSAPISSWNHRSKLCQLNARSAGRSTLKGSAGVLVEPCSVSCNSRN